MISFSILTLSSSEVLVSKWHLSAFAIIYLLNYLNRVFEASSTFYKVFLRQPPVACDVLSSA